MSKIAVEIIMWFFMGSIMVLVVTHAAGFSQATKAATDPIIAMGTILTGK